MVVVELRTREPIVALRLFGNRLFRSANGVMILGSMAFLGTLYAIALYYQDGRGLSPLQSGLNTFPEAVGVMLGAQLASRFLYPFLGPRRHIALGLSRRGCLDRAARPAVGDLEPVVRPGADVHARLLHGPGLRAVAGGGVRDHPAG